jgi:hypothetical protein
MTLVLEDTIQKRITIEKRKKQASKKKRKNEDEDDCSSLCHYRGSYRETIRKKI